MTLKVSEHPYDLGVKGQGQIHKKNMTHNANSSYIFLWMVFIFSTINSYSV